MIAILSNLANPKVIRFYLAFESQFVTHGAAPIAVQMLVLGLMFIVVGLSVDGTAGLLSGALSERTTGRAGFRRWMERVSAGVFAGLAAR